jgi:dephospho-CoA kinase
MSTERIIRINVNDEIDRLFDDSSLAHGDQPAAVILMGNIASGKTTLRREKYARGYVLIDAAEMFHHMSQGDATLDFPTALLDALEPIGQMVANRAISEKRHIVTEIVGADFPPVNELISALKTAGYHVEVVAVVCELEESIRRNETRGNNISAHYAEPFQQKWIIQSCRQSGGLA